MRLDVGSTGELNLWRHSVEDAYGFYLGWRDY
jgi:hypothetical protein